MPKRILSGIVRSAKADKTISVSVSRKFKHPLYQKIMKKNSNYLVHDPENKHVKGDKIAIIESRPISKLKHWVVLEQ
ncbi:30S ribosomal protein S17 [Rickettsia endosymbiont of Cardiosporidium cionae]|uniref:30S ribosomal protein S17 n=1 Tax=Rickettsia endosymbiont of Cardiosporidium cionae TaxID=2777155 RepID=UPI001893B62B|nr:30S ribosomal protein S17 [Rickettsia endosymbiont of Cardiosporidium cionae]KAF8818193.1 30S ribosomal protein S17 [Rickettsia endosymbiont of Cardiosporidium cionae]